MNETVPTLNPSRTMFLVMDYQAAIVAMVPNTNDLLPRMAAAIDAARRGGVRVGYVRVAFEDADFAAIPPTNKAFSSVAAGRRFGNQAPETAIHDAVAPQPGDLVVRKIRVGAFSTTDLHQQLRAGKIDTIVLAGLTTSGVVLSTVREAADLDYRIYVLEECCADHDREVHNLLIQKVFPRQAHVISVADFSSLLGLQ